MNYQPPPPPPPKGAPTWVIVFICLGASIVFILPIFATLAVYGVRKYLANARANILRDRNAQKRCAGRVVSLSNEDNCPEQKAPRLDVSESDRDRRLGQCLLGDHDRWDVGVVRAAK